MDLGGRCAIPGLTDGHAHMDREGLKRLWPSLDNVGSIGELKELLAREDARLPAGGWLVTMPLGRGPDYAGDPACHLREERLPTRADLDDVCSNRPVLIRAPWGYWRSAADDSPLISICNSAALAASGLDDRATAPTGVVFERDLNGRLTGVIREKGPIPVAETVLLARASRISDAMRRKALDHSMSAYLRAGVTCAFEGHGASPELLGLYRDADEAKRLRVRVRLVVGPSWGDPPPDDMAGALASWYGWARRRGFGNDLLRIAGLYGVQGGGERDRLLAGQRPYSGWAGYTHESSMPPELFREFAMEAARQGFRLATLFATHLDLFAEVDRRHPIGDLRWVIGHVGRLTDAQTKTMRDLGMGATLHTNRSIADIGPEEATRLGPEACSDIVPTRRLVEAGVPFALSSDNHPVGLFGPIAHCVTRRAADGALVAPDQALSREEALEAAAIGGAWLTFEEDHRGSLQIGKLADIAILDADPLTCAEETLPNIEADCVILGGEVVLENSDMRIEAQCSGRRSETPVYRSMDQSALDLAYDQRAWARNAQSIIDWYASASDAARARLPVRVDIPYGDHPLERFDLYPAASRDAGPRACLIYVHGGAWKLLSKRESGFFAEAMTEAGVSVAALDFGKRPETPLSVMVERVARAIDWISTNAADLGFGESPLILCGHSSGAHIAAAAAGSNWRALGRRRSPIAGALFASGPYDLVPVVLSARGRYLDLDPEEVVRLSARAGVHRIRHPVSLAVGGRESPEFIRQTQEFYAALKAAQAPVHMIEAPEVDHFEISQSLADPEGSLFAEVMHLLESDAWALESSVQP
ncbi:MAG: amidohydrolase family protein [Alphaproteobacteria bacterium]|nr:amidohydrolase family protein [Alphaproteobacteria bacterium]